MSAAPKWAVEMNRAHREAAIQSVRAFVHGAIAGNCKVMANSFDGLTSGEIYGGGWARAMRCVSKVTSVPRVTQEFFLRCYIHNGDHIRGECEDLSLFDGLRVLLPRYAGPAVRLYRGDSFHNRSRRTYGPSWTGDIEVGRGFAKGRLCRSSVGGSVLLETLAPAKAIICAPCLLDDRCGEDEYIVDRRRLASVKVIDRFSQVSS